MTRKCGRCRGNAEFEVRWEPHGRCQKLQSFYCAADAETVRTRRIYCATCGHDPVTIASMNPWPGLSPYEKAREVFIGSGFIADKEAMLEHVTLASPPGWDTFGSLLAWPPGPAPVPWRDRRPVRRAFWAMLAVICAVVTMGLIFG